MRKNKDFNYPVTRINFLCRIFQNLVYFSIPMRLILVFILLTGLSAHGQSLRDINFSYLYSQTEPFTFKIFPVREGTNWNVFYELKSTDTAASAAPYSIQWELRDGLGSKDGVTIPAEDHKPIASLSYSSRGNVSIKNSSNAQLLVARVKKSERIWLFYTLLDPKFPVNGSLSPPDKIPFDGYIRTGTSATAFPDKSTYVAYYNDAFPAATPAFAEGAARVAPAIIPDSTWQVGPGENIVFPLKGLYLLQTDTTAAEGFTVRAEDDYPRLAKVESLADPLTYVCTSQEVARVRQAKGDKKAFDRVILSITLDQERARRFMKSYYRRVEIANQMFSSYKEGWKTDRGMIYIVFGPPDRVFRTAERELWYYKSSDFKIDFEFTRSPTLFDPENYVLIRHKKFETTVYEVIDQWRNARF
jgi:GWxTD domain-containing protein